MAKYNSHLTAADRDSILADGVIDEQEVLDLIDSDVDFESLMSLAEGADERTDHPSFMELVKAKAKAQYLDDPITTNEIDDDEVENFLDLIDSDGTREKWEIALAEYLYNESANKPEALRDVFAS
jgi:hypothetical protein